MRRRVAIKVLSVTLLFLIVCAGALASYTFYTIKQLQIDPTAAFTEQVEESKPEDMTVTVEDEEGKTVEKTIGYNTDIVNLVALGIDSNEEREAKRMGYRSDTIIVAAINMKEKTATMITVPRDTRVKVKTLNKNGNVKSEGYNKINAAFALGGRRDNYSYQNSMDAISTLLGGIPLKQYVGIDMDGIGPLADAVGGVPLKMDVSIPKAGLEKGKTYVLKGDKAMAYVRERHIEGTGGSDVERTKRQQRFVKAFLKRVKEMNPVTAVPNIYNATKSYIDTNLTMDQIAAFALVLKDMDIEAINVVSVPGQSKTINGGSYWVADEEELSKMLQEIYYIDK